MADWWRKNMILAIINLIILAVTSIVGLGVMRVVNAMDNKAEKAEVNLQFNEAMTARRTILRSVDKQTEYINEQNRLQDEALEKRLLERDKINSIILNELSYIKKRVDKIPTK